MPVHGRNDLEAPTTPDRLTRDVVTDALRRVPYPGLTRDIVSFGMVRHVAVCD
jgi:metal-sulfur cluster biosynthetic enzyme